jgi:hypothetical protein
MLGCASTRDALSNGMSVLGIVTVRMPAEGADSRS